MALSFERVCLHNSGVFACLFRQLTDKAIIRHHGGLLTISELAYSRLHFRLVFLHIHNNLCPMSNFINFTTFKRGSPKNSFLQAPAGVCQNSHLNQESPRINESASDLSARLVALLSRMPNIRELQVDETGLRIKLVAVTPFMRFKDDVSIEIFPSPGEDNSSGTSSFAIYSASRIGRYDFGANAKRVNKWTNLLVNY